MTDDDVVLAVSTDRQSHAGNAWSSGGQSALESYRFGPARARSVILGAARGWRHAG